MSLRKALAVLPDDRATAHAVHEIMSFFVAHEGEGLTADRVASATALSFMRIEPVLKALASAEVIDCDGDPRLHTCIYSADTILALEVKRYLRVADGASSRQQSSINKFRGRYGSS